MHAEGILFRSDKILFIDFNYQFTRKNTFNAYNKEKLPVDINIIILIQILPELTSVKINISATTKSIYLLEIISIKKSAKYKETKKLPIFVKKTDSLRLQYFTTCVFSI